MTDQTNAELIAEAEGATQAHEEITSDPYVIGLIDRLAATLENAQTTLDEDKRHMDRQARRIEENREEIDRLTRSRASAHGLALRMEKRADAAERELRVAEDQANTIAGDLAQAERERDALVAVVEKASDYDEWEPLVGDEEPGVRVSKLREWVSAPADLLREHDAALIEGLAGDVFSGLTPGVSDDTTGSAVFRWLREKARQRREEQDRG